MSKYSVTYNEQLDALATEDAINDIDKRLAALESKVGEVETKPVLAVTTVKIERASVKELLTIYKESGCETVAEHVVSKELDRRLNEAAQPTARQRVAEAFLHAALSWAPDMPSECGCDMAAEGLRELSASPNSRLARMAAVLEDAAREEGCGE